MQIGQVSKQFLEKSKANVKKLVFKDLKLPWAKPVLTVSSCVLNKFNCMIDCIRYYKIFESSSLAEV